MIIWYDIVLYDIEILFLSWWNTISPRYFWFHQEFLNFTKIEPISPRFFGFHQESTHFTKCEFHQESHQVRWTPCWLERFLGGSYNLLNACIIFSLQFCLPTLNQEMRELHLLHSMLQLQLIWNQKLTWNRIALIWSNCIKTQFIFRTIISSINALVDVDTISCLVILGKADITVAHWFTTSIN